MATEMQPMTGVELNTIEVKRKRLSFDEAVTAHILFKRGASFTEVVHRLGTNANRVGEIFRGEVHPKAAQKALELLLS